MRPLCRSVDLLLLQAVLQGCPEAGSGQSRGLKLEPRRTWLVKRTLVHEASATPMVLFLTLLMVTEDPVETRACPVTPAFGLPCYIPNAGDTTVTDITSQPPPLRET